MQAIVTDNLNKQFLVDFATGQRQQVNALQAVNLQREGIQKVSQLSDLSYDLRRAQYEGLARQYGAKTAQQLQAQGKVSLDSSLGFRDADSLVGGYAASSTGGGSGAAWMGGGGGGSDEEQETASYEEQARLLFPWMPPELVALFAAKMAEFGGEATLAIAAVRQDPVYDTLFPGNRRDDGSLRLTEQQYFATVEGYRRRIDQFGLNPDDVLRGRTADLISGDVSPAEFEDRLNRTYTGIIQNIDQIRGWYADNWGADGLSDAAIFASAINPDIGAVEFQARIAQSQIGGEADQFGFDIDAGEANRMFRFGLDQQGARSLYAQASEQLPRLNQLIGRFNDPDDEVSLEEFSDAVVINDPTQLRQIARLFGRSRSAFSSQSRLFEGDEGRFTGLLQR